MDVAVAKKRLGRMTGASIDPVLTSAELDDLLNTFYQKDSAGRTPSDPDFAGKFFLFAAAAEGWRWKAAKCADRFNFAQGDENFSRSQTFLHCVAMAELFDAQGEGTLLGGGSGVTSIRVQGGLAVNRNLSEEFDQLAN